MCTGMLNQSVTDEVYLVQGPRNLYGRDGKFRPLLKVGEKASIFRPTFDDLMALKCTKWHRFAPIFSKISRG